MKLTPEQFAAFKAWLDARANSEAELKADSPFQGAALIAERQAEERVRQLLVEEV